MLMQLSSSQTADRYWCGRHATAGAWTSRTPTTGSVIWTWRSTPEPAHGELGGMCGGEFERDYRDDVIEAGTSGRLTTI